MNFVLERFLPESDDEVVELCNEYQDDLDVLNDISERADYYRERFGMSADSDIKTVFNRVNDELTKLKNIKTIKNNVTEDIKNEENKEN